METEMKHTPGKWHFRTGMSDNFCEIIGDYGTNKTIAVAPKDCFVEDEEAEANGRIIAAAPDMLEALKEALDQLESWNQESEDTFTMKRIREAINKATL